MIWAFVTLALVFLEIQNQRKTMKGLESATGYMKKRISETLDLRHTPKLIFKLDESFEKAALMNELIIKVSKEDREKRELYGNANEEEQ